VPEDEWEQRRNECDQGYLAYYPSLFHSRTMRSIHEFLEEEMITTLNELQSLYDSLAPTRREERRSTSLWRRGRSIAKTNSGVRESAGSSCALQHERNGIVFVCIEDARLDAHLASELGSMVRALENLEVLILKGVGLSSIAQVQGSPRLLYLDVSGNNLCTLADVLRLVRECDNLLWGDFEGNPVMSGQEAEAMILASSSWSLRHLNKHPIEIRRKVAAIIKHGDPAARSTLCYQVWDAQVCSSPGVAARRNFEPSLLQRLQLPAAGLSVFHVGLFSALRLLDLSVRHLDLWLQGGERLWQAGDVIHLWHVPRFLPRRRVAQSSCRCSDAAAPARNL
jgi:Leucine-rich repeat (LRR) protein